MTEQVLAVLVRDRRSAIARDYAFARSFRLRRRIAAAVYALANGVRAFGTFLDEECTTIPA